MRYVFDGRARGGGRPRVDSWTFVSVPTEYFDEIQAAAAGPRGFGSVRVAVHDRRHPLEDLDLPGQPRRTYVLPIKKAVRTARGHRRTATP